MIQAIEIYETHRIAISAEKKAVIADMITTICKHYGISENELLEKTRRADIVMVRAIAYYCLRHRMKLPFATIGKMFNKHHATVMHSVGLAKRHYMSDIKQFMG